MESSSSNSSKLHVILVSSFVEASFWKGGSVSIPSPTFPRVVGEIGFRHRLRRFHSSASDASTLDGFHRQPQTSLQRSIEGWKPLSLHTKAVELLRASHDDRPLTLGPVIHHVFIRSSGNVRYPTCSRGWAPLESSKNFPVFAGQNSHLPIVAPHCPSTVQTRCPSFAIVSTGSTTTSS